MKRTSPTWILAALLLAAPAAGAPEPEQGPLDEGKAELPFSAQRAPRLPFDAAGEAALLEAEADTDVTHYLLDIEIIPEFTGPNITAVRVEGVSTIDFAPTIDGLTTFTVDLHSALTVNDVTGDVASWSRVGNTIEVTLDQAYDTGDPVQIAVDYDGYPVAGGFGAFKWWIRNGDLVVATLSEPFYARFWWPCKDALDDKSTMQMHVTVPSDLVALSNGIEVGSEALSGSRTKYRWHETHPMIPYLASLAITSYERYEIQYDYDDGGTPASMPVPCFFYTDHWDYGLGEPQAGHKAGCDQILEMLDTLTGLFGDYPFLDEKYGVVETGGTGGLGASMEHQTLSSMNRINGFQDIMAHEVAHQWWGDEVTCETWYDIWLNEAFASYSEVLFREFKIGGTLDSYWIRMNARRPANPDGQVYRTNVAAAGAIFNTNDIYNKGAWVLHMLRHVMGDAAFFEMLADYRAAFADDSATTDEFRTVLSASFGEDLGWFVDQWVLAPGSPDYEWNSEALSVQGRDYLRLAIWQTQDLEGYGLFTMPIDVRVTTASGTTVHTVWNDDWTEHYVLALDGPPISVEIDAEGGIANRNRVLWDTLAQVATPLDAPPALLEATRWPGGADGVTTFSLTFSEDIGTFAAADLALIGSVSGAHAPDLVHYDALSHTATVAFDGLPPDTYTLSLLSAEIAANGKALDGEIDDGAWWDSGLLPSGDGQPGGDAAIGFTIAAQAPAASLPVRGLLALLLVATGAGLSGHGPGRIGLPSARRRREWAR